MLEFAAISPHPPIIIPQIGQKDLKKVQNTAAAMVKLAQIYNLAEIDTLIVISPHMNSFPQSFNLCAMENLRGDFGFYNQKSIAIDGQNDLDLVDEIYQKAQENGINCNLFDNDEDHFTLDHGIMVPLYYLKSASDYNFKILPIALSSQDKATHFTFGQIISEVAQKSRDRIGILASGDLSHRLFYGAPSDCPEAGVEFDRRLVEDISKNSISNILYYDDQEIEAAGECGFRSILILLGALDNQGFMPQVLSYEGPFGVGYLVANFKKEK